MVKNNCTRLSINKYCILGIILYIPFVKTGYFATLYNISRLFSFLQFVVLTCFLVLFIIKAFNGINISKSFCLIIVLYLILSISTILNHTQLRDMFRLIIPTIAFCLMLECFEREQIVQILRGFSFVVFLYLIINIFTVLLFENGLYQGLQANEKYYFLGHNNATIRWVLPGIIYSGLYDIELKGKFGKVTYLMSLILLINVSLTWSNASMIGSIFIFAYLIFYRKINFNKTQKLIIQLLPLVLFIIFVMAGTFQHALGVVAGFFGKDATLSGRTDLWEWWIYNIKNSFLLGYGFRSVILTPLSWRADIVISSFHNLFMDLIYQGGVFYAGIFYYLYLLATTKVYLSKNNVRKSFGLISLGVLCLLWNLLPYNGYDSWTLVFIIHILNIL